MKDLIAKLQMDATCAMGALWIHIDSREAHIDAQAARIAELEAQIAAASAPAVGTEWKSLNDVQWMNIVNHDHAYFGWDKEDAVHHAVKATEAKLRELNSTALQAPVREVPEGMPVTQEPKYGIRDNRLFNRASGEFIPEDEPVFIFRARDRHAIYAIAQYKGHYLQDESHKEAVGNRIKDFRAFMESNPARMKEPDTALPAAPVQEPKP